LNVGKRPSAFCQCFDASLLLILDKIHPHDFTKTQKIYHATFPPLYYETRGRHHTVRTASDLARSGGGSACSRKIIKIVPTPRTALDPGDIGALTSPDVLCLFQSLRVHLFFVQLS
jgi:hypothetical protein